MIPSFLNKKHVWRGILYAIYSVGSWLLDYGLYAALILYFNAFIAIAIMVPLMLCIDIYTLIHYSKTDGDWFGIEDIKSLETYTGNNLFKKLIRYANKQHPLLKIALLSIEFNPFLVTIYVRPHGQEHRKKITKKDWKVFFMSFCIGSAYWAIVMGGGVTLVKEFILKPLLQVF